MARYRLVRTDFWVHPKTRGLGPLERDLILQGISANIAGVLERSTTKMAKLAGGKTTTKDVESALLRLEKRGLVKWWPELETLWVVEAADEQAKGTKAWGGVKSAVAEAPIEVRHAFVERYPDSQVPIPRDSLSIAYRKPTQGVFPQDQYQEQDQDPATAGVPAEPARGDGVNDLWLWFESECVSRGHARKRRGLSTANRRAVDRLLKHIRETLEVQLPEAIESQRAHLRYRLATAPDDAETRKRIHGQAPWRQGWWDWWHQHAASKPAPTNGRRIPALQAEIERIEAQKRGDHG